MHPEAELIPYLRNELSAADRDRVAAHVAACPECRRATEESRAVLAALTARKGPPPMDWARYQADLRARLAERRRRPWWARPLPTLAGAAAVATAVLLGIQGLEHVTRDRRQVEVAALEEAALGAQLPLLREYPVVERLDMLEDLDVIRQLDRLDTER